MSHFTTDRGRFSRYTKVVEQLIANIYSLAGQEQERGHEGLTYWAKRYRMKPGKRGEDTLG
jgi:hypothetical protein